MRLKQYHFILNKKLKRNNNKFILGGFTGYPLYKPLCNAHLAQVVKRAHEIALLLPASWHSRAPCAAAILTALTRRNKKNYEWRITNIPEGDEQY